MPNSPPPARRVTRVIAPPPRHWVGDGFHVRSMFSYADDPVETSPFLLLDYAAPMTFRPTRDRRGVGPHPHRGFETVTVAFAGEIEHRDSLGHHGRIGPGDVQWMTAASGVLHEELQTEAFSRAGGTLEMAQVWVNLPARRKTGPPAYQDLRAAAIPTVALPGDAGDVRVIAGVFEGTRGPARTATPVELWDVRLRGGREAVLPLPSGHTGLLLVTRGPVAVADGVEVDPEHLAVLSRDGEGVRVAAASDARVLVLAGEPIDEPVVGRGPFVMNTWDEISQAIHDLQDGRFGVLRSAMDAG
ncbi:MAG: pirin family protein [Planctomycetota bacterium]